MKVRDGARGTVRGRNCRENDSLEDLNIELDQITYNLPLL